MSVSYLGQTKVQCGIAHTDLNEIKVEDITEDVIRTRKIKQTVKMNSLECHTQKHSFNQTTTTKTSCNNLLNYKTFG